jgi:hypothetical protein
MRVQPCTLCLLGWSLPAPIACGEAAHGIQTIAEVAQ